MGHRHFAAAFLATTVFAFLPALRAQEPEVVPAEAADEYATEETPSAYDPIEPCNRVIHVFNDRLFLWVIDPIASGYAYVIPEAPRRGVDNFFENLAAPIRILNNSFQLKFDRAGHELERFGINSTFGVLGFSRAAEKHFKQEKRYDEDFGQTLGHYGAGPGPYLVWPFFGPSNVRDTFGLVGDALLNPLTYLARRPQALGPGIRAGDVVNHTSLRLGDYQEMKNNAFDPYIFFRDAYTDYREGEIQQ